MTRKRSRTSQKKRTAKKLAKKQIHKRAPTKFEYDCIQKSLKEFRLRIRNEVSIKVAVSGGIDSMVLLEHLLELKKQMPLLQIQVLHFHHGATKKKSILRYRNRAQRHVEAYCKNRDILFFTNTPSKKIHTQQSESELRKIRTHFLEQHRFSGEYIAKAHHADDQFETQLIRLIRGTGAQGFQAMSFLDSFILRPLITWTKADVVKYAHLKKIKYIQDPSNKKNDSLRNWIRNQWLKDLEVQQPGRVKTFRESFQRLSEALGTHHQGNYNHLMQSNSILRREFVFLNKAEQRSLLASYMHKLNLTDYKLTHIDEILKRIDSPKKMLTFELLKCLWTIDTQHITAKLL